MPVFSNDVARVAAEEFACGMAAFCDARLGTRLLWAYLIGILAHGGFCSRYSDIDMALTLDGSLGRVPRYLIRAKAAAFSLQFAPMLSIFWTT
ncbi:MAG: hypothetical protein ACLP3R_09320 [Candidatus Korobacteraceae bacterium]